MTKIVFRPGGKANMIVTRKALPEIFRWMKWQTRRSMKIIKREIIQNRNEVGWFSCDEKKKKESKIWGNKCINTEQWQNKEMALMVAFFKTSNKTK